MKDTTSYDADGNFVEQTAEFDEGADGTIDATSHNLAIYDTGGHVLTTLSEVDDNAEGSKLFSEGARRTITLACGFNDLSHFGRVFAGKMQMTPSTMAAASAVKRHSYAQPLNRARKSAIAYHHSVVLAGTRRTWTASMIAPPTR